MLKKMLILGITVILLFSLSACGYPTERFKSLEEMQEAISESLQGDPYYGDLYFFDFEQEGIKETGKFQASKLKRNDGSYRYFRYSVWYSVEYEIDGQKQKRELRVAITDDIHLMSFGFSSTEAFRTTIDKIYNSWLDRVDIDELSWSAAGFDKNKRVLYITVVGDDYFYRFILEGVRADIVEKELETFLSILEFAIINRYQIT